MSSEKQSLFHQAAWLKKASAGPFFHQAAQLKNTCVDPILQRASGLKVPFLKRGLNRESQSHGQITNIQKFCLHDGPGIRTTVFFKGCPLTCPWCANPEAIHPFPELVAKFESLCIGCGRCEEVCPHGAMTKIRAIDRERCLRCFRCVEVCPSGALSSIGTEKTASDILRIVEQDRAFYQKSGGGMTISGGEPLFQFPFLLNLAKLAKRRGLHVALDTSGLSSLERLQAVLPYVDLVLFDIKHVDAERHRQVTGVDNRPILRNLRYLDKKVTLWIRIPLIPGFNSDDASLSAIFSVIKDIHVQKVSIIPLHRWGQGKYASLGRHCDLAKVQSPSNQKVQHAIDLAKNMGLTNVELAEI